ncbi:transcriptional repressor LexA [Thiohalocapsa marina]|uniref:transcriptional repressor LexA n=1 Tax=Thiohalocapsa marina TaxID=424902 RepID=UPI0036DB77B5
MTLTRRQQIILERLRAQAESGEPPPTLDELCALLGLKSRGSLHRQVQALVEAGLVEPMRGQRRGVRLVPQPQADNYLPLLGKIAAGRPIEALANPEPIEVPSPLRTSRPCYVLKVEGESMREAGILDGDYVVIEQRDTANDGEIVVALIRGEEATLKRIVQRSDRVILYPENSALSAQEYRPEEVQIQGVLVGQMRVYR